MRKTALLAIALLVTSLVQAQRTEETIQMVRHRLDSMFKASQTPGVSFSLVLPNGTVETFTEGYANVEKQEPMTAETQMLGGSTGKMFYSVVAMQLIDEGKLKLDQPVIELMGKHEWFKRLPNASDLTVRNLMRHETGIPRYVFKESFQEEVLKDADRIWKPAELLSYVLDDEPLFSANADFAYSDTNYIILCMVIEEVTGNDIYDEVQTRVLDKAGLKGVVRQTTRTYPNLAQGYNAEDDGFFPGKALDEQGRSRYNLQFEWAGGGLVITTRDLAVLAKKIYEGEMFSKETLAEYLNGRDAGRLGGEWGLGVHIQRTPEGTVYGHSGFMPGYVTNVRYYVKDRYAVCYQINTSDRSRMSIMRNLSILSAMVSEELNK